MNMAGYLLRELEIEAQTTRRVLERVPSDKLVWKPHEKSMSLGTLALHVATVPAFITGWATQDTVEFSGFSGPPDPTTVTEVLAAQDDGVAETKEALAKIGAA